MQCRVSNRDSARRAAGASNGNGRTDDEGVGHNVDLPAEVLLDGNTVLSDHYAEVTGETAACNQITCMYVHPAPSGTCAVHLTRLCESLHSLHVLPA